MRAMMMPRIAGQDIPMQYFLPRPVNADISPPAQTQAVSLAVPLALEDNKESETSQLAAPPASENAQTPKEKMDDPLVLMAKLERSSSAGRKERDEGKPRHEETVLPVTSEKDKVNSKTMALQKKQPTTQKSSEQVMSIKRPAAAVAQLPDTKRRRQMRPAGCSKCRGKPGCTPSCWRGWLSLVLIAV